MASYRLNGMAITIEKEGTKQYIKSTSPTTYGKYSEVKTSDFEFRFNMNGEIKFIRGLNGNWPHPSEVLKRTDGNDWVYYSVGTICQHRNVQQWLGEYYLPCLPYSSNSIYEYNPYTDPRIMTGIAAWSQLFASLWEMNRVGRYPKIKDFLDLVIGCNDTVLFNRSKQLHSILGGGISVLPPDTRHVDYDVIPLMISDGCLYHCEFCDVKSRRKFQARSKQNILEQIQQLKTFYGRNLVNYKGLFLGDHDALGAGKELVCYAASAAADAFGFRCDSTNRLYLFGSVDTLLAAGNDLFDELNALPFYTCINIGFESMDPDTLAIIKKPLDVSRSLAAFEKMLTLNQTYQNIEVTGNFILGDHLPERHNDSLADLLANPSSEDSKKGAIYLSPLTNSRKRDDLLQIFFDIKRQSRLPTYIYLIQRL